MTNSAETDTNVIPKPHFFPEIDLVKAFAAFAVILIHVLDRYTNDPTLRTAWMWSHFAVGPFVIASGFLQDNKELVVTTFKESMQWLLKRVWRLVLPYYIYVIAHASLILLLPDYFNQVTVTFSWSYICNTITLHSGFMMNWIPRVFVLMTIMYLIMQVIKHRFKLGTRFYWLTLAASLLLSVGFYFWDLPFSHGYIQALTWFAFFLIGILLHRNLANTMERFMGTVIAGLSTTLCFLGLLVMGRSTSLFAHKYPPTIFYISYDTFVGTIIFNSAYQFHKQMLSGHFVQKAIRLLSKQSYTMFFVSTIIFDFFRTKTGSWPIDFCIVSVSTIAVVCVIDRIGAFISKTKPA